MKISELLEKRRNQKHPAQRSTRKQNLRTITKYINSNLYFGQFTTLPKIGINPKSKWGTPIGVYTYPLAEFKKAIYDEGLREAFPYASESEYFNIIVPNVPVVELIDVTENDLKEYGNKIQKMYNEYIDEDLVPFYIDHQMDFPGQRLWDLTKEVAYRLGLKKQKNKSVSWNTVLRSIGIKAISDRTGQGIIHPNEQTQAVFLTKDQYTLVERIKLKYTIEDIQHKPELVLEIQNPNWKQIYTALTVYPEISNDLRLEKTVIPDIAMQKLYKEHYNNFWLAFTSYGSQHGISLQKKTLSMIIEDDPFSVYEWFDMFRPQVEKHNLEKDFIDSLNKDNPDLVPELKNMFSTRSKLKIHRDYINKQKA